MNVDELDYYFFHCPVDSIFYDSMLPKWIDYYYSKIDNYNLLIEFMLYFAIIVIIELNIMISLQKFFDGGIIMKHKFSIYLSICLVVILCVPSVRVSAAVDYIDIPGYYTIESVDGFFSGTDNGLNVETVSEYLYNVHNDDIDMSKINTLVSSYSEPSGVSEYNHYYLSYRVGNGQYYLYCFYIEGQDPVLAFDYGNIFFYTKSEHVSAYCIKIDTSNNVTDWTEVPTEPQDRSYRYYQLPSGGSYDSISLFYSNSNLYYINSASALGYTGVNRLGAIYNALYESSGDTFYNYCPRDLPYYDGNDIVIPDNSGGLETNNNHMYFNSCDFGFCEPINVNSFSNFGGAYFYAKYNVDDWVLNHIGDYKIEFHVDCYVGNQHYSFTTREALDPDLVLTVPFSYFDGFNYGFSTYITNQKIDKSFLKTYLYCIKPDQYSSFYNKINSAQSEESLHNMLNELANYDLDFPAIFCYTNSNATYLIKNDILTTQFINQLYYNNRFDITCNARLIDESGHESGWVSREFDLVQGSSISTNNDGLTNENPYIGDSEDLLPYIPDNNSVVEYSGSNGSGLSVYNMTPSEIKLTLDNGLEKFVNWYNTDSSVGSTVNGFWNSMGIFKNNPAAELYREYFDYLPSDFKSILFGAATIGIVGGAFAILRKKLT